MCRFYALGECATYGSSKYVWIGVGDVYTHSSVFSTLVSVNASNSSGCPHGFAGATTFAVSDSYIMYRNTTTDTADIILPAELTRFQPINASG